MKCKYNIMKMLVSLFIAVGIFTGCGYKPQEPDVTAKAYYDLFILGDSSEIEKIGMPKDDVQELIKKEKESMSSALTSEFSSTGFNLSEAKVQELTETLIKSISRLKATTEVVSKEEDKAVVKISSNYIDLMNICTDAATSTITEVQGLGLTDVTEAQKKFINVYVDKVIESLSAAEPSSEVIEKTFDFKLEKVESDGKTIEVWEADDMFNFGLEIGQMAMGVK